jgi:hypothetical protein
VRSKVRISALLLVIVTGLPVSGTMCAFLCEPASRTSDASAHHGDAACAQTSQDDDSLQMRGLSGHDCRSHTLTAQPPATLPLAKGSTAPSSSPMPALVTGPRAVTSMTLRQPAGQATPRGTPPLSSTRIILRV